MFGRRTVVVLAMAWLQSFVLSAGAAPSSDPSPAAAEETNVESAARDRAKQLYAEGVAAYREGKHSDAIDKLLEADRVMPNAAFSYNIALVYEAMGDQRSALRWLRSYLRQSKPGTDQTSTLEKLRKFEAQLQARGLQQVSILTVPPGAMVKVDGVTLGLTPFTTELPPGSHVASLNLDGHEPTQKSFELRADRSMDIDVTLTASRAEAASTGPVNAAPTDVSGVSDASAADATTNQRQQVDTAPPQSNVSGDSAPVSPQRSPTVKPWTWISLGVGTALLGGALGFELKRQSDEDAAKTAPQATYLDHYERMESSQTFARIFVAAGAIVSATGLTLLTLDLTRGGSVRHATFGTCPTGGYCAGLRGQF